MRTTTFQEIVTVTTDGSTATLPSRSQGRAHLMIMADSTNTDAVRYQFADTPGADSLTLAAGKGIVLSQGAPYEALHLAAVSGSQKVHVLEVV